MALSERPRVIEPSSAPDTLNRGGEPATSKRISAIQILKEEKFMGVPKIISAPILGLLAIVSVSYLANKAYHDIPPVHRVIDKALDMSLGAFGLRTNQESPEINYQNNNSGSKTK